MATGKKKGKGIDVKLNENQKEDGKEGEPMEKDIRYQITALESSLSSLDQKGKREAKKTIKELKSLLALSQKDWNIEIEKAKKDAEAKEKALRDAKATAEKVLIEAKARADTLKASVSKKMQELKEAQGVSGLHPNSPRKLAVDPYKYAIKVSIIETLKSAYPGKWIEAYGANNRVTSLVSIHKNPITVDVSDMTRVRIAKNGHSFERDYSQGLKKWIEKTIHEIWPKETKKAS